MGKTEYSRTRWNICCSGGNGENKTKRVKLIFHREQLLYDIKNYAYIEGHVWGGESGETEEMIRHAKHTLMEIGEEGNIDRVNRILALTHAAAVEMLYPYTKEEPSDEDVICDAIWEPENYVIEMEVPGSMSGTTINLLSKLIHEFMVARVIYDWLSITHAEAAKNWHDKAEEARDEIERIKNLRRGPIRRKLFPY